jgi:hypothetical protein
VSGEVLNVSRGGFFCSTASPFPKVGQVIEFNFVYKNAQGESMNVEGFGVCRWVRERVEPGENTNKVTPGEPYEPGFGIEFLQLTDESRKAVNALLDTLKSDAKAYIPKGRG